MSKLLSELYAILSALGENYISKVPKDFWDSVCKGKNVSQVPTIDKTKAIYEQGLSREAIVMTTHLKIEYWCNEKDEKEKLLKLLEINEEKLKEELSSATSTRELMKLLRRK